MSRFVKDEIKAISISGIRRFNQKASLVDNVIKLTIGELNLDSPSTVKEATVKAVEENKTRYTTNKGISVLREKIAEKYKGYDLEEVILTVGTTEGLAIVLKSIINEGDEVIIPTPGYVGYAPLIQMDKGVAVEINTLETNNKITRESLEKAYSSKTKALIVTSPNNPTGYVLDQNEMDSVREFVLEKDIVLISDEIYSSIVFDKEYQSFSEFADLKNNLVVLNGFSKSHAMTGYRIGYVLGPIELIEQFVKVHQYHVTSTSTLSQYAALNAIEQEYDVVKDTLKEKRNLAIECMNHLGLDYVPTNGAFYLFYDISKYGLTSLEYCDQLLYDYQVAMIPGEYFLGNHSDYVRLSFAGDLEDLKTALKRIEKFDKAHS